MHRHNKEDDVRDDIMIETVVVLAAEEAYKQRNV